MKKHNRLLAFLLAVSFVIGICPGFVFTQAAVAEILKIDFSSSSSADSNTAVPESDGGNNGSFTFTGGALKITQNSASSELLPDYTVDANVDEIDRYNRFRYIIKIDNTGALGSGEVWVRVKFRTNSAGANIFTKMKLSDGNESVTLYDRKPASGETIISMPVSLSENASGLLSKLNSSKEVGLFIETFRTGEDAYFEIFEILFFASKADAYEYYGETEDKDPIGVLDPLPTGNLVTFGDFENSANYPTISSTYCSSEIVSDTGGSYLHVGEGTQNYHGVNIAGIPTFGGGIYKITAFFRAEADTLIKPESAVERAIIASDTNVRNKYWYNDIRNFFSGFTTRMIFTYRVDGGTNKFQLITSGIGKNYSNDWLKSEFYIDLTGLTVNNTLTIQGGTMSGVDNAGFYVDNISIVPVSSSELPSDIAPAVPSAVLTTNGQFIYASTITGNGANTSGELAGHLTEVVLSDDVISAINKHPAVVSDYTPIARSLAVSAVESITNIAADGNLNSSYVVSERWTKSSGNHKISFAADPTQGGYVLVDKISRSTDTVYYRFSDRETLPAGRYDITAYICTSVHGETTTKSMSLEFANGSKVSTAAEADNRWQKITMTVDSERDLPTTLCFNGAGSSDIQSFYIDNVSVICREEYEYGIKSAQLTLTDSINMSFYATIRPEDLDYGLPYAEFTVANKTGSAKGYRYNGEYIFTIDGLLPQNISDTVRAEIYNANGDMIYSMDYSIAQYAENILAKIDAGIITENSDELETLILDLIAYGREAQIYKEKYEEGVSGKDAFYDADLSASRRNTLESRDKTTLSSETYNSFTGDNAADGITWIAAAPVLEGNINLRLRFTSVLADLTPLSVRVYIGSESENKADEFTFTATNELKKIKSAEDGSYYVDFGKIAASELDKKITAIFLYDGVQIGSKFDYSISSYVYHKKDDTTNDQYGLVKSLYNYGCAAKAYNDVNPADATVEYDYKAITFSDGNYGLYSSSGTGYGTFEKSEEGTMILTYGAANYAGTKYMIKPRFKAKTDYDPDYKFMRVLYAADTGSAGTVKMMFCNDGNTSDYVEWTGIDSTDELVLSPAREISDIMATRLCGPTHCSLTFMTTVPDARFEIAGLYFFKTKEEAEAFYYEDVVRYLMIGNADISKYKVVVAEDASNYAISAAKTMTSAILSVSGVTLNIVDDSTAETEFEIVIGKTNRSDCDEYYGVGGTFHRDTSGYDVNAFECKFVGNKIILGAGSEKALIDGAEKAAREMLHYGNDSAAEFDEVDSTTTVSGKAATYLMPITTYAAVTNVSNPVTYTDSFASDDGYWSEEVNEFTLEADPEYKWSFENGTYVGNATNSTAVSHLQVYEKNVTFTAKMKATSADTGSMGLMLRYCSEFAYVKAGYDFGTKTWFIEDREGADFLAYRVDSARDTSVSQGTYYNLKLVTNGSTVTLYSNNAVKLTATVKQVTPGRVALFGTNSIVTVDEVNVSLDSGQGTILKNVIHNRLPDETYREGGTVLQMLSNDSVTGNPILRYIHGSGTAFTSKDWGASWDRVANWTLSYGYPNIIRLRDGVTLIRSFNKAVGGVVCVISQTSTNDGLTWVDGGIICEKNYPGTTAFAGNMNDKITQMSDGRIFYSQNFENGNGTTSKDNDGDMVDEDGNQHRVFCVFYYSDDNGLTWNKSATDSWTIPGNETQYLFGECKILETSTPVAGKSYNVLRVYNSWSPYSCIVYSESYDNGVTWGQLQYLTDENGVQFITPQSSMQFAKDPYADNESTYYMVWVYGNKSNGNGRTRLSLAKTTDGKTWKYLGDIWRWEYNYRIGGANLSHIVDPFIYVTEDYILCGSGFCEKTATVEAVDHSYHQAQRQHIYRVDKSTVENSLGNGNTFILPGVDN